METAHQLPAGPLEESGRVPFLDILRGIAILGIFPVNLFSFALTLDSHLSPWFWETPGTLDLVAWSMVFFFCVNKFYPLFAMLFGAGIGIQTDRLHARNRVAFPFIVRRLGILAFFGMLHVLLLWEGDILLWYAMLGFLAFLFCSMKPASIGKAAVLFLIFPLLLCLGPMILSIPFSSSYAEGPGALIEPATMEMLEELPPMDATGDLFLTVSTMGSPKSRIRLLQIEKEGPLLLDLARRIVLWLTFALSSAFGLWWIVLGYMLAGLYLVRTGILLRPGEHRVALRRMLLWGAAVGLPLQGLALTAGQDRHVALFAVSLLLLQFSGMALAAAITGAVGLLSLKPLVVRITEPLQAAGRMALTNYVMQSFIMALTFGP